jgi:hypothetical protein
MITGKYLFSNFRIELKIVIELKKGGFFEAKINSEKYRKGDEAVLRLY